MVKALEKAKQSSAMAARNALIDCGANVKRQAEAE
jgi:hypothetical protein